MEYPKPTIRFENPNGVTTVIAPREDGECAAIWYEFEGNAEANVPPAFPNGVNVVDCLAGLEQDPNAIPGEYEFIVAAAELVDFMCESSS
jgi:hypothetical protein